MTNIKKRLFIVSGTFTTAIAATLIKQLGNTNAENYIVSIAPAIYENLDEHIKAAVTQLGVFKDLKFYFDFCAPKKMFKEEKKHILSFNVRKFKESIGNIEFDEICSVYIHGAANYLFNQYPKADLYFVEDGTATYLKMDNAEIINKRAKKIFTLNYFDKIKPFVSLYEGVPCEQINKEILKDVFAFLSKQIKFNLEPKEKSIIFCAQNISLSQIAMTYEDELKLYISNIKKLLDLGYFVYFKEHPKTPNMFYKNLIKFIQHPNFSTLGAYAVVPMETLVPYLKPCAVVSMFSSSLFTMPWLFNIPSFTFMPNKEFKDHKIFGVAHMLVATYIPPIEFVHKDIEITQNNFKIFLNDRKSIEKEIYYRIKTIDFFKFFISRNEYYQIKREIKNANKLLLRYFNIPTEVLNIFRNGSYLSYLKYYFNDFKSQYNDYKKRIKTEHKSSLKQLTQTIKDSISCIFKLI